MGWLLRIGCELTASLPLPHSDRHACAPRHPAHLGLGRVNAIGGLRAPLSVSSSITPTLRNGGRVLLRADALGRAAQACRHHARTHPPLASSSRRAAGFEPAIASDLTPAQNPPRPALVPESWAPGSAPNPIRTASDVLFQSMSKPGALSMSTDAAPLQRTPSRPVMPRPFDGGSSSPTLLRHENGSPSRDSKGARRAYLLIDQLRTSTAHSAPSNRCHSQGTQRPRACALAQ